MAALVLLFCAFVVTDKNLAFASVGFLGLTFLIASLQWWLSASTRCPLCLTPILSTTNCAKHRKAKKLLGSYRLRLAVDIVFNESFTCPYCHEPTAMLVRDKHESAENSYR